MTFDPSNHDRRSMRLKGYDYASEGVYLVTICTYQRQLSLATIDADGQVLFTTVGCIVQEEWERTAHVRPNVTLDAFVIMPNHLHGIIVIGDLVGVCHRQTPTSARFGRPVAGTLGVIVGQFKSLVTKRVNRLYGTSGTPVWQRNFHDQIIRTEASLNRIRRYIDNNPHQWTMDRYNNG